MNSLVNNDGDVQSIQPSRAVAVNLGSDTTYTKPVLVRVGTTAGDVKVVTWGGDTVTIPDVLAGESLPVLIRFIFSTANGTTAVGLTAFS